TRDNSPLSVRVDGRDVQAAVHEPVVLPRRTIRGRYVCEDLEDVAVGITDAAGSKAVALPSDDVFAAVLDPQTTALAAQRPRHAQRVSIIFNRAVAGQRKRAARNPRSARRTAGGQ